VLRALRVRRPDQKMVLRSPLARWFFDFNLGGGVETAPCQLDVGVVQADSLSPDLEATQRAYAAIDRHAARLLEGEVAAAAPHRPALVFADIPALAFDVAARLGVPGVAMTNFSWDWIYADYARDLPAFTPLIARLRASYGRSSLLLRLPLHGDLSAFARIRDLPLVARRATVAAADVRARLRLPVGHRLVLMSFGGLGLELPVVPRLAGVTFIAAGTSAAPNVHAIPHADMTAAGVRYEDLVGACDAVMTKPGYGIVAECIANETPIVYTERGRFAEYPILVAGIAAHLPNAFIASADLRAGRWATALEAAFGQPRRAPAIPIDGAEVAAEILAGML
jgi:hypothetical protein